jgi:hypothetical protein
MNQIYAKVFKLHNLFTEGNIPTLAQHEVHPDLEKGGRENYLYFTLPPCINFQRSSPAMWQSAYKTWNDVETNYVFFPEKLALKTREEIQMALIKYRLALQTNKHTDIWIAISKTLHEYYEDNPRNILQEKDFDAEAIIQMLQKEKKHLFPYLGGSKLSNYWLFILSHFTDVEFKNMHAISIIPDTHVIKSTQKLWELKTLPTPQQAEELWFTLLKDTELSPVDMHSVLWNWSRNNFRPEV